MKSIISFLKKDNNVLVNILIVMEKISEIVSRTAYELLKRAVTKLPLDVKKALERAYERERSEAGRAQLKAILSNIEAAEKHGTCICQDTGIPLFFVKWGLNFSLVIDIKKPIVEATRRATLDVLLRPNVINPLTKENLGTNVGWGMPYIYYEVDPEADYIEITALPKGFGSEAKSNLVWIVTSESIPEAIIKCVIDNTLAAMGEPCPPTIVGLGIGGTGDIAMYLAKKALLRTPLGSPHPNPIVAEIEQRVLRALNATGLGPMAMGGDTTCLAVHAEICGSHTAGVPLGITYQCWAARYSTARIYPNREVEYITHPEQI
ncbi:MAG: fumarate hydratase [Candidatus Bathyarchaeia archaeon]